MSNQADDHPTQEPFTSTEVTQQNHTSWIGYFLMPFAALGGMVDQIIRKFTRANHQQEFLYPFAY
ncbi:hypothetical protein J3Q64DRAFT_1846148 [Phycomyces blakesleeanus]|uniref:Uncharacterized protein n=2 Tax=Phycomyces blakesleeanus TaxID=4837 RepID=A0A163AYE1_PHYB8|nr:hypothetical protein PHYBLDRAFT_142090 [Phycomyces blakesleeanus NRRL 1555(-)]OAD76571.1 hypothetical protein PHYBLDRAFT_142090 [Phycomyces blakesleeanus NRRL 1555(-)]|eukprot:XP_018294611.1 hypothetical protein PHYBLDRAFT_142090 [Phycomyces blakesleeanus NRRL 1555(-)]